MPAGTNIKAIVCDVNGTMFSLEPIGKRMQQVGLDQSDLEVCKPTCSRWFCNRAPSQYLGLTSFKK